MDAAVASQLCLLCLCLCLSCACTRLIEDEEEEEKEEEKEEEEQAGREGYPSLARQGKGPEPSAMLPTQATIVSDSGYSIEHADKDNQ
ncbi:uncharacterized protein RAG0_01445 [Rhynchosporium agropyri]|uniref:Uncharacterized protein n=1 Tax=Rhynchosporium agropyri TaxID=914238 RepID=A0A1E1JX76_9HELO|nr:uncharacterized protein RAG0_01445 [Rhynchosporium agropyri]